MMDEGKRTVECLRGRLLAEREATKAAEAEAELMAKRVVELERQLGEEIERMKRAEKRMRYALKKLEPIHLSSSQSEQCGLGKEVGEMHGDDGELSAASVDYVRQSSINRRILVHKELGAGRRVDSQVASINKPKINTNANDGCTTLSHARDRLQDSIGSKGVFCSVKQLCSQ